MRGFGLWGCVRAGVLGGVVWLRMWPCRAAFGCGVHALCWSLIRWPELVTR